MLSGVDAYSRANVRKLSAPVEKALAVLEDEAGRQFDPEMAPLFVRLVREGTILVKADDDPAKEPDKDSRK